MKSSADQLMEVGVLAGTHGLRGDLKVRPLPTGDLALSVAQDVFVQDSTGRLTAYRLQRCSPHKQFLLIHLEQIDDIDSAKALVGSTLLVDRARLPDLDEDQILWSDLQGLTVVDCRRGPIGEVEEMFSTAAHDILVVRNATEEILIPAIPPFIQGIDDEAGELLVDLPDGMVSEDDEV